MPQSQTTANPWNYEEEKQVAQPATIAHLRLTMPRRPNIGLFLQNKDR